MTRLAVSAVGALLLVGCIPVEPSGHPTADQWCPHVPVSFRAIADVVFTTTGYTNPGPPSGEAQPGRILLQPALQQYPNLAAKVCAHEYGHEAAWFAPNYTPPGFPGDRERFADCAANYWLQGSGISAFVCDPAQAGFAAYFLVPGPGPYAYHP